MTSSLVTIALSLPLAASAVAAPLSDFLKDSPAPARQVYKKAGGEELNLYVFQPADAKPGEKRAGVVCIHGGGWTGGAADVFFPFGRYLAARGAVAFSVQYRLVKAGGPDVADCVTDCKSALRYIRAHATEFGVDPQRLAVLGDSAGGHLAACLGTLDGFDDPADDKSISAKANAMVLYNPLTDFTDPALIHIVIGGEALGKHPSPEALRPTAEKLELARKLSPVFNVRAGDPPAIALHGLDDRVVAPDHSKRFAAAMEEAHNVCKLVLLENTRHAFVIPHYTASEATVVNAMRAGDSFLISLGYLAGEPTLAVSPEPAWMPKAPPSHAAKPAPSAVAKP